MATMATVKRFYSMTEAAQELGVSYDSVKRGIDRGHIPVVRIGRQVSIPAWAIEDLLAGRQPVVQPRPKKKP